MTKKLFNRRDFLKVAGLTTLGVAGACAAPQPVSSIPTLNNPYALNTPDADSTRASSATSQPTTVSPTTQPATSLGSTGQKKRVLRIAHMTDLHVEPRWVAEDGMRRALRHAQAQADPPDIILNTGDSIMESLKAADKGYVEAQWELYNTVLQEECKLPVVHAIGNHDVWGWGVSDSGIKNDPLYGKGFALEKLGLSKPYYSFDMAGWHFVVLDSTHPQTQPSENPYIGRLDDEQYQWMMMDIEDASMTQNLPICIVSHIPIVAACEYFDGPNEESGNWVVPAAWMHIDARKFRDYFLQASNVKLCLSGHTHQYETLDYLDVRYMTNAAICGNWWNGVYMDFPPAYVMVNLYDDGSADSLFVPYDEG